MKKMIFCFIISFFFINAKAQKKDNTLKEKEAITTLNVGIGLNFTGADFNERYGLYSDINFGLSYKTVNNFVFTINSAFLLGNNVFQDDLSNLFVNSSGNITGLDGSPASLGVFLRGNKTGIGIGKIVKKIKNDNSGFFISLNTGYISHKIKYVDGAENLPNLNDAYLTGFDKLSSGLFVEEFIGILFLSEEKLINFKIGFTFLQGFTKDKRAYFYASDNLPNAKRKEIAYGIRAHWVLPLYREKKISERYYID